MHGKSARFIEIYEKLWQNLVTWNSGLLALCVHCCVGSSRSGVKIRCSREIARHFFQLCRSHSKHHKKLGSIFSSVSWERSLNFPRRRRSQKKKREKKLASLCRYPSHSSWWKSDVHCLFVFYIHPLRTINKPLPNLLDKESNDIQLQKEYFCSFWSFENNITLNTTRDLKSFFWSLVVFNVHLGKDWG